MQSVGHMHKWTNILADELRANYRPYAHQTIYRKQANETLATNHLTYTEPQIRINNQNPRNIGAEMIIPSTLMAPSYLQQQVPSNGVYLRQAYSIQKKRRNLRQRQIMDTFDHIQQFSYIKQRHHPINQYCALQMPVDKKIQVIQKPKLNVVKQIRTVVVNTPPLIMPPIQPVRHIFQPIPMPTIVQPLPQTYKIIHNAPQASQKMRTLEQARKTVGFISPNKNMSSIQDSELHNQFIHGQKTLQSPYQQLESPRRYHNEWLAKSTIEETPRIVITEPLHQEENNRWNMPQENIGKKSITESGIWKAGLTSSGKGSKDQTDRNGQQNYQKHQKTELNQSLQIFNGQSGSGDSVILFPQGAKP